VEVEERNSAGKLIRKEFGHRDEIQGQVNRQEMRKEKVTVPKLGRRPREGRRHVIQEEMAKYGDGWRDHFSEILEALDRREVALDGFSRKIDLGEGRPKRVSSWQDLDLTEGNERKKVLDAFRKYAARRK